MSNALAVLAFSLQPVTQASALSFTAPLMLIVFGALLLHERIGLNRWLGVASSFIGMLLIVRPEHGVLGAAIATSIGGAGTYALYQALVRGMRAATTALDSALQFALVGTVLLAPTMVVFWHPMGLEAFGWVVVMTVVQTCALACIAAAMRRSETSRLAPWQFSSLLWAMFSDLLIFGHAPTLLSVAGGGLIILGGLLASGGWRWRRRLASPSGAETESGG